MKLEPYQKWFQRIRIAQDYITPSEDDEFYIIRYYVRATVLKELGIIKRRWE